MFETISSKSNDVDACSNFANEPNRWLTPLLEGPFDVSFETGPQPNVTSGFFGATIYDTNGQAIVGGVEIAQYDMWRIARRHYADYSWANWNYYSNLSTSFRLRMRITRDASNNVLAMVEQVNTGERLLAWTQTYHYAQPVSFGVYYARCAAQSGGTAHTASLGNWRFSN